MAGGGDLLTLSFLCEGHHEVIVLETPDPRKAARLAAGAGAASGPRRADRKNEHHFGTGTLSFLSLLSLDAPPSLSPSLFALN